MSSLSVSGGNIWEPQNTFMQHSKVRRITSIGLFVLSVLVAVTLFVMGEISLNKYTPIHEYFNTYMGTENNTVYIFYYISIILGIVSILVAKLPSAKLHISIPMIILMASLGCFSPMLGAFSLNSSSISNWLKTEYGVTSTSTLHSFREPLLMENAEGKAVKITFETQGSLLSVKTIEKVK